MSKRATDPPLYKRGDSPYWWTWIYEGGQRKRVSTRCTDRRAALSAAAALQRQSQDPRSRFASETVADALAAYLEQPSEWSINTVKSYGDRAAKVASALGSVRIVDVTREHVEQYVRRRLIEARPDTVLVERRCLTAALRHAKLRGREVPDLEALAVRVPGAGATRERWLTHDEYERLCWSLPAHRALWVCVAVHTGARRAEVNALTWTDVDFGENTLRIGGTKSEKSDRKIPLAAPMRRVLEPIRQQDGPLVRRWAGPSVGLPPACRRAGIPHCSAHDFRRTFASWLLQRGISERYIADMLGQEGTELVRQVYAHLDLATLQLAVARAFGSA